MEMTFTGDEFLDSTWYITVKEKRGKVREFALREAGPAVVEWLNAD
jgi:hypothetical protein